MQWLWRMRSHSQFFKPCLGHSSNLSTEAVGRGRRQCILFVWSPLWTWLVFMPVTILKCLQRAPVIMLSLKPGHWDVLSQRFPRDTKRHKALTVLEISWSSGQEGNGIGATWPSREDTLSHFCNKGCWGGWRWNAVSTQFWGPGRRPASFSSQELLKSTPHTLPLWDSHISGAMQSP